MELGDRIRLLRKKRKITQPELAASIGVHETTIRRWEQGKDKGSDLKTISLLAKS